MQRVWSGAGRTNKTRDELLVHLFTSKKKGFERGSQSFPVGRLCLELQKAQVVDHSQYGSHCLLDLID